MVCGVVVVAAVVVVVVVMMDVMTDKRGVMRGIVACGIMRVMRSLLVLVVSQFAVP